MAYPIAGTPVQTQFATSVTSMAVNMPATVDSGDLLLAFAEVRNAGTWTVPTDWTEFKAQLGGSSVGELTCFYKIASGTEDGGTATWTASTGTTAIWQVIRVTGWHGTTPPEATSAQGDYTTNPNPPTLSPSWGAEETLWLEIAGNTAISSLTTGASTNYSGYQSNTASSGGSQCTIASAYRQLNASSEDPGVFANAGKIRYWAAVTIAIRPASAVGGGDFEIADETSGATIDNVTLQFQGNFEIADEESYSSIDNITIERNGGDFVVNDESSASSIENITLGQSGELLPADENSASTIDNITLEVGGGSFVVENEASPSSIDNITLEQNGGTLAVGDTTSTSEIDNIALIGNFIIGDVVCETTTEEITLEFEGATLEIEDIASTSEIDNIPLVGDFIIQDIHAPPTIENITLEIANGDFVIGDLDSSSAITNIRIVKNIPDELKTIFIVNRGKVAKWISGNNYIEL